MPGLLLLLNLLLLHDEDALAAVPLISGVTV
jgi:hypothetical protein